MLKLMLLQGRAFNLVFEGEENTETAPENTDPPVEDKAKIKVKLDEPTQKYVNSLLAEERRKAEKKNNELITQLETQKNLSNTTAAERAALESRIDDLRAEFQTKEQLTTQSNEKKIKELEKQVKDKDAEAQTWTKRFQERLVTGDLTDAAVKGKAFNPKQVVTILKPMTRIVEEVDEQTQKPTGEFTTRVKLPAKDKDGQPTVLDLAPADAVKQLAEMPEEYGNLFINPATGGLGGGNLARGGGGKTGPITDTSEYMLERRKQRSQAVNKRKGINS
jgi:uncharacterized protein YdiU (UPF0061 family)